MIREVVDQGTGGVRRPDVQLTSTGQGEDKEQKKAGVMGKVEGRNKANPWILVVTTSQGTRREQ